MDGYGVMLGMASASSFIPGDPHKKGSHLQHQSNVTQSQINLLKALKTQRTALTGTL